eukprot:360606-Prorocentrum_minimum.AAC.2
MDQKGAHLDVVGAAGGHAVEALAVRHACARGVVVLLAVHLLVHLLVVRAYHHDPPGREGHQQVPVAEPLVRQNRPVPLLVGGRREGRRGSEGVRGGRRGSIGQVKTPARLRTRLKVKNTRGIFKVCCTVHGSDQVWLVTWKCPSVVGYMEVTKCGELYRLNLLPRLVLAQGAHQEDGLASYVDAASDQNDVNAGRQKTHQRCLSF